MSVAMAPKRGKVTRAGKQFVLPARSSDVEVARDQELLTGISRNLSLLEAEEAVAQIRKQREQELKRSVADETDAQGVKRARIKRSGKDFYLPSRTSDAERARDQELLDAISKRLSVERVEEAVAEIRKQSPMSLTGCCNPGAWTPGRHAQKLGKMGTWLKR